MSRTFKQHAVRRVQTLDGQWTLVFPATGSTIDPAQPGEVSRHDYVVPGVWEQLPGRESYRGQALAQQRFTLDAPGPCRLVFKGVSHTARVFVDGREVGHHHNAYTPFAIDLPHMDAGEHELLLHISNEHGELSALHFPNDYYNYGGITRPCELQQLSSPLYIRYCHMTPRRDGDTWHAHLRTCVVNMSSQAVTAQLSVALAGAQHAHPAQAFAPGATHLEADIACPGAEPWSPQSPKLYTLAATLRDDARNVIDDWTDRTGFRTVTIEGTQLRLNGKLMFPFGFNRHEDHAEYGCALPLHAITRDLDLMQELGANAVRTCHYPNDERMLDLCDERGLLVWEENHARGINDEKMHHPRFRDQCRDCIDEMIHWHYNHPSIVIWGILNECASETEYGRSCYAEQFAQIKSLDTSRPTTFASCRHLTDICQDLPDIASWNYYFGWYHNPDVEAGLKDELAWLHTTPAKGKPHIVSEFGGGAIPGYRDPLRKAKWSEERQCMILDQNLTAYLDADRFAGAFIWQFADCRVHENFFSARPRTMNNKGVVDEYRKPKLAFDVVRSHFRAFAAKLNGQ